MKLNPPTLRSIAAVLLLAHTGALHASSVPVALPAPDGKPGDATKPVKVYILAGQSNMVGMGDITGARPPHPCVYLSADPAIIPGEMPAGTSRVKAACQWIWRGSPALEKHGVYQNATGNETGAKIAIYEVSWDANAKPIKTTTVPLGVQSAEIPKMGKRPTYATAFIDVPVTGNYLVHVGFGDSSHAIATLEGKEAYRKESGGQATLTKVDLEAGKRYPLKITYLQGGSAALWLEQVELVGQGDLVTLTNKDGKFPYLIDEKGGWSVRNDVYYQEARVAKEGKGSPLSATSNGNSIGPEVGFGFVMGTHHDEQVLLIKTAMGNRSLGSDFRPPSSGRIDPDSQWEGLEYRLMLKGVRQTLENIDKVVPGYTGQGYEIAGFGWFQGHKDSGSTKEDYEKNLVNLIKDLRKDLAAPEMKAVVAAVGFHGYRLMAGPWKGVWEAQMAVGDPKQHPDFAGSVASVDTRDFWREVEESPRSQDYHYHRNPEFYMLTGEAMGRAMVRLMGGQAEEMPKSDREAKTLAMMAAEAAATPPTAAQVDASNAACKPMIIDGLLAAFLAEPKVQTALQSQLVQAQPTPAKHPEYLDDAVDDAVAILQAAGISDYDWQPVIADMQSASWEYTGFDLVDSPYKTKPQNDGKKPADFSLTYPAGHEQWFAPDFDPKQAGWKTGRAPFGIKMAETVPEHLSWIAKYPIYPLQRTLPATVIENDVVLMRQTFELPPLQDGHRYRIRVNGSIHDNSGEGYAIYINGKPLAEAKSGVTAWRKQGLRGSHVWQDFLGDFKGGKVTIAVANFPMNNYDSEFLLPAIGPLSVWLESQKLPELRLTR